jgi:hypothetical protein
VVPVKVNSFSEKEDEQKEKENGKRIIRKRKIGI